LSQIETRLSGANGIGLPLSDDLLHGADEIAQFIYGSATDEKVAESNRRRIYHSADRHGLPAFKLGGTLTARKSTILAWIESQERAA
jgi:hypothetical protein